MKSYLICYDIQKNALRTRLGNKIIEYGLDRVNKSVYLGSIEARSLKELENWLQQQMQDHAKPGDSLILLPVTAAQIHAMRVFGENDLDRKDLSGELSTLIL